MRGAGISYQTAYNLLRKPWRVHRLDLDTLARLCSFFQCEPGDLLAFNPDALPRARPTPLVNRSIRRSDRVGPRSSPDASAASPGGI